MEVLRKILLTVSIFGVCSGNFEELTKKKSFVDRTRFAKMFYDFHRHPDEPLVMTAPSGCGKTAILDMMERFFRVEVGKDKRPLDSNHTTTLALFRGGYLGGSRQLEVASEMFFFTENIAKYPVVRLDFNDLDVTSFDTFLRSALAMVRKQYNSYPYVKQPLGDDAKATKKDVTRCGIDLTKDLHDYFGQRCIVLIDAFDAPGVAFLDSPFRDAKKINDWLVRFLTYLLKNNKHLEAGFLTGRTRLSEAYSTELNNTVYKSFVREKRLAAGFTLSSDIVKDLLKRFESKLTFEEISNAFSGYRLQPRINDTERKVFPTLSVITSIESKKIMEPWQPGVSTARIVPAFRLDAAGGYIVNALRGGAAVVKLTNRTEFSDIEDLRSFLDGANSKPVDYRHRYVCLFLQYLYELGYFTNIYEELGGYANFYLANREIGYKVKAMLDEALASQFTFSRSITTKLKKVLDGLDGSEKSFQSFLDTASEVIKPYLNEGRLQENILAILLYAVKCAVPEANGEVLAPVSTDPGGLTDLFRGFADALVVPLKGTGVVINYKVGDVAVNGLKQIFDKRYDKHIATCAKKIFIGLHFDVISRRLSASCLCNSSNHTLAFNILAGEKS